MGVCLDKVPVLKLAALLGGGGGLGLTLSTQVEIEQPSSFTEKIHHWTLPWGPC